MRVRSFVILNADSGHIIFITLTVDRQHHAVDDACSQDHTRTPSSRPAPPRGLRLVKMASIMEGPLSKWTNVMKGWQYRWFVLDYNAGLLSYYTVSRFPRFFIWETRGCLPGHIKLPLLVRAQSEVVRACCLSGVGSLSRQSWAFLERWIPASANHDGPVTLADQLARSLAHFR